ncbi:hypothetical protein VTK73DRAFT_8467 [Phialemonium thermophilum]|uniref:Secreted protein n=1 Tax=Phialemonium thermophilum TaxID=223376 RepID=A0ABR3W8H8_9PEZI
MPAVAPALRLSLPRHRKYWLLGFALGICEGSNTNEAQATAGLTLRRNTSASELHHDSVSAARPRSHEMPNLCQEGGGLMSRHETNPAGAGRLVA